MAARIMSPGPLPTLLGRARPSFLNETPPQTPSSKLSTLCVTVIADEASVSEISARTETDCADCGSPLWPRAASSSRSTSTTASSAASTPKASSCSSPDAAPLSFGLVVRNTFLDFANEPRRELPRRRRARSLELPRTTACEALSLEDVAEGSIANVGVGRSSEEVPYRLGQLLDEQSDNIATFKLEEYKVFSVDAAALTTNEAELSSDCGIPSIGSAGHRLGNCVPCGYFWKSQGCVNGSRCEYCHLCDSREKKRRQKARKSFFKAQAKDA